VCFQPSARSTQEGCFALVSSTSGKTRNEVIAIEVVCNSRIRLVHLECDGKSSLFGDRKVQSIATTTTTVSIPARAFFLKKMVASP
jgi:hypothetical protein